MSAFSFTVPTWFLNEQPPGSRDQPTSSADQPTTGPLPVQMCSQCTLCSAVDRGLMLLSGVPENTERGSAGVTHSRGSTYCGAPELRWHVLLLAFCHRKMKKCELNYSCRWQLLCFRPLGSCGIFHNWVNRGLFCYCVWPGDYKRDRRGGKGLCKHWRWLLQTPFHKRKSTREIVINPIDSHYGRRGRQTYLDRLCWSLLIICYPPPPFTSDFFFWAAPAES